MTLSITDTRITSDLTDHYAKDMGDGTWGATWPEKRSLTREQASAAMELVEVVAKGRDDTDTTNYAYLTWQRVKVLAEVLGVVPLKTVLDLEKQMKKEQ